MSMEDFRKQVEPIYRFYEELNHGNARAAAILVMAALDDELLCLIRKKFPADLDERLWERLHGPGLTPFGTFKAKADIAQAFGYYGPKTRQTLSRLARVRNRFAHVKSAQRFIDDDEILEACAKLNGRPFPNAYGTDRPNENDVRLLYISTAQDLHLRLEDLADHIPEIDPPLAPLP